MVNPGHASSACDTCKARRIRCDASHPVCQKCVASHRVCLGYTSRINKTRARKGRKANDTATGSARTRVAHSHGALAVQQETEHIAVAEPRQGLQEPEIDEASGLDLYSRNPQIFSAFTDPGQRKESQDLFEYVVTVLSRGFSSLRTEAQDPSQRKELLASYGELTHRLRSALETSASSNLAGPIFLLSLYEMVVNIDAADKTWGIHLDGLLEILSQSTQDEYDGSILLRALRIRKLGQPMHESLIFLSDTPSKLSIMFEVAGLELYAIAKDIRDLFASSGTPRKIDAQRLCVQAKIVYKNLQSAAQMLTDSRGEDNMRKNQHRTLCIIVSRIIMDLDTFLLLSFQNSPRYRTSRRAIQQAVFEIQDSSAHTVQSWSLRTPQTQVQARCHMSRHDTLEAMALLWPLKCAYMANDRLFPDLRKSIKTMLDTIGRDAAIPQALSYGRELPDFWGKEFGAKWISESASIYVDILGGLIIANLAVS